MNFESSQETDYSVEGYCKSSDSRVTYLKTNDKELADIVIDILSELCDNGDLLRDGEIVDSVYLVDNR